MNNNNNNNSRRNKRNVRSGANCYVWTDKNSKCMLDVPWIHYGVIILTC